MQFTILELRASARIITTKLLIPTDDILHKFPLHVVYPAIRWKHYPLLTIVKPLGFYNFILMDSSRLDFFPFIWMPTCPDFRMASFNFELPTVPILGRTSDRALSFWTKSLGRTLRWYGKSPQKHGRIKIQLDEIWTILHNSIPFLHILDPETENM